MRPASIRKGGELRKRMRTGNPAETDYTAKISADRELDSRVHFQIHYHAEMPSGHDPAPNPSHNRLAAELDGLVDLGAERQIIQLVSQILRLPKPTAIALVQVIRAISMLKRPRRWRSRIEAAYTRLSKPEKHYARGAMLAYYCTIWEPQLALRFCKLRHLDSPGQLMNAMHLHLHANDLTQAKKVARKCRKAMAQIHDAHDASCLAEALGRYYARTREWQRALKVWTNAPRDQPMARDAAVGRVEIFLAQALVAVREELAIVASLRGKVDASLAISLPGIEDALLNDTAKDLRRFENGIPRLLPQKRQKAFGLSKTA